MRAAAELERVSEGAALVPLRCGRKIQPPNPMELPVGAGSCARPQPDLSNAPPLVSMTLEASSISPSASTISILLFSSDGVSMGGRRCSRLGAPDASVDT